MIRPILTIFNVSGKAGAEEHSTEVHVSSRTAITAGGRTPERDQARGGPVREDSAQRRQGAAPVCHQRRSQEGLSKLHHDWF